MLCKKAQLLASSKNPREEQQNKFELDLEKLNIDGKVKAHPTRDVAVVQIGVNTLQPQADTSQPSTYLMTFVPGVAQTAVAPAGMLSVGMDTVKKFDDVLAANDVYILGYPSSIGIQQAPQIDYGTPLVRKGIVAGLNRSNKTIVLDCMSFSATAVARCCRLLM